MRLAAIANAAESIKAKSFTIDGEAVVLGPDGLSRFEELSRREAAQTAVLYAFDLIEPVEIRQTIDAGALTVDDLTAVFALTSMTGSDTGHCRDYRASHAR